MFLHVKSVVNLNNSYHFMFVLHTKMSPTKMTLKLQRRRILLKVQV